MQRTLLVVTGLSREARAAEGLGIATVCSGGDSARLSDMLGDIDPRLHWGVVSFGIAGGLDPDLEPGHLVLGRGVVHEDEVYGVCADLSDTLRRTLYSRDLRLVEGAVVGVNAAVMTPEGKAALRAVSGAVAVDMESHVAASWAARHDLPFGIVRVVSDPAHRALPALAADALNPDGGIAILRVLAGLAKAPGQIGALANAGLDARIAFAALTGAGRCLGPRPTARVGEAADDLELA